jgi:8-oxo-dGTP pyrophosphatase MutT (NUDIX family)
MREILEETGLSVDFAGLRLVYSGTEVYEASQTVYVRLLYVVKLDGSTPAVRLSFEHDSSYWDQISELANIETDYIQFYAQAFDYLIKNQIIESLAN